MNREGAWPAVLTTHQQGATPLLGSGFHHNASIPSPDGGNGDGYDQFDMASIFITDIESAINYWRGKKPSPDGFSLAAETRALAEVYAVMAYRHEVQVAEAALPPKAMDAWRAWYDTTPDTPCIAICSTSQGDEECKGCGRSFTEVQRWLEMTPVEKRQTWQRITRLGAAWRFNKYAERAAEKPLNAI